MSEITITRPYSVLRGMIKYLHGDYRAPAADFDKGIAMGVDLCASEAMRRVQPSVERFRSSSKS